MTPYRIFSPILVVLALALSLPAQAQLYKCQRAAKIIYQNEPCPAGTEQLPLAIIIDEPTPEASKQAQARAKSDIKQMNSLNKAEAKADAEADKAARKQQAAALKHERECQRLRDSIDAHAASEKDKHGAKESVQSRKERMRYLRECGPL